MSTLPNENAQQHFPGDPQALEDFAYILYFLAKTARENQISYLQTAAAIYEALHSASPHTPRYQSSLLATRVQLERALRQKKRADKLRAFFT